MELLETKNHIPKGDITMIPQKQLSLADIFEEFKFFHHKMTIILTDNQMDL